MDASPASSPRNGEGTGNEINYDDENTIKINYKDVDGDGEADRLVINEDSKKVEYKTQGSVFIKQDKSAKELWKSLADNHIDSLVEQRRST